MQTCLPYPPKALPFYVAIFQVLLNFTLVFGQAPEITTLSPTRNALSVVPSSNVSVTFSQAMNAATASNAAIQIHGSQTGTRTLVGKGSFSGGGTNTITFDPTANFKPGEQVSVSITTNAQGTDGTPLVKPQVYNFTAAATPAPATFLTNPEVTTDSETFSVQSADFDGDGDMDMAAANRGSNTVSVLLNDGNGSFSVSQNVAVGLSPRALWVADFDVDGDMDLATANFDSNDLSIRFNNGSGSFSGTTNVSLGVEPYSLTAGDFDGDGDVDLATANINAGSASVCLNNGSGSFPIIKSITISGGVPSSIYTADFDNDGNMDIALGNISTKGVAILVGDGLGNFLPESSFPVGEDGGTSSFISIEGADFDKDGDVDIITGNLFETAVYINFNDGSGHFSGNVALKLNGASNELVTQPYNIRATDFDGDGDMDIAAVNNNFSGIVYFLLNNGQGSFPGRYQIPVGSGPKSICSADFDGDGDLDMATGNSYITSSVSVLINKLPSISTSLPGNNFCAGLNFSLSFTTNAPFFAGNSFTAQLSDASGNFANAVTIGTLSGNESGIIQVSIPAGTPTGTGYRIRMIASEPAASGTDNGSDLVVSNNCVGISNLSPARNAVNAPRASNVSVTFSQAMNVATASNAAIKIQGSQTGTRTLTGKGSFSGIGTNTITFDPTADFKPGEQVSASITTNALSSGGSPLAKPQVFNFMAAAAAASASFVAGPILNFPQNEIENLFDDTPSSVCNADMDGDGDLDVAVLLLDGRLVVELNDSTGKFSNSIENNGGTSDNYFYLQAADLDNDGDVDLIHNNQNDNTITRLLNDGTGHFPNLSTDDFIPVGHGQAWVHIADLDGDGDMDLAAPNRNANSVSLLLNDGTGHFFAIPSVPVGNDPQVVNTADVDNDGDLDLAITNYISKTVSIRFNNGAASFTDTTEVAVANAPAFLRLADLDGDGDADLITATNSSEANSVSIRLNDGTGHFPAGSEVAGLPAGFFSLSADDLDGDGDIDFAALIAPPTGGGTIFIQLNDGKGHFSAGQSVRAGNYPIFIATGDLDGDGDIDISVADNGCFCALIFLNQSITVPTCQASGTILREYWANVAGHNISDIPLNAPPSSASQLNSLRTPANAADNYAQRLRGYICAPATGNFTFFLQGDDNAELWLSTDNNPANTQRIASAKVAWSWTVNASQQSAPISLVAGKSYYLEVLHKEASGGDQVRVGWRTPSMAANAEPLIIPGSVLSPFDNSIPACSASGTILGEYWANVAGHNISDIPLNTPPTSSSQLTSLRTAANAADNYAQRIRGYICAPSTGNFTFFLQGDDQAQLFLSKDDNPANKQGIASASLAWGWAVNASQQSVPISLVGGQSYYLEVLHKESSGGDQVRVGWRTPQMAASAEPVIIPGSVLSPFIVPSVLQADSQATIPAELTDELSASPNPFSERATISFTTAASGPVRLEVYDLQGRLVGQLFAGLSQGGEGHHLSLDGRGLAQGLYLVRLATARKVTHQKLLLTR